MKICVYGAGAIGCSLAARLAHKGAEVSLIARGATLAAIREKGLFLKTPSREISARVQVSDDPASLVPQDAVIVAVKAPSLPSIASGLGALVGAATHVAFVMNGIPWWYAEDAGLGPLDPGGLVRACVPLARTIGGVIFNACEIVAPGVVHVETVKARLILGHPDGKSSDTLNALAAHLRDDDFIVEETDRIRQAVWTKLQTNISAGLLACLSDAVPRDTLTEPACASAYRQLCAEIDRLASALGYPIGLAADKLLATAQGQGHRPTIARDLLAGAPMEYDGLFGAPMAMALAHDVPVPLFSVLTELVKIRAKEKGAYR